MSQLGRHALTAGVDWRRQQVSDPVTYLQTGGVDIDTMAVFAQDQFLATDAWRVTLGARLDHHPNFGSHLSPKLYANYFVAPDVVVKGGVSTAFKAPDAYQLSPQYSIVSCGGTCRLAGNPALTPEQSRSAELGIEIGKSDWEFSAVYFHNDVSDLIVDVYDPVGPTRRWANVAKAVTRGLEMTGSWSPDAAWTFKSGLTLLQADYTDVRGRTAKLEFRPAIKLNLGATWAPSVSLSTFVDVNYTGAQYAEGEQLPPYTRVDLGAAWRVGRPWTLRVGVKNLGDVNLKARNAHFVSGRTRSQRVPVGSVRVLTRAGEDMSWTFLALGGAVGLCYLASTHQRVLAVPLRARWAHGTALVVAALALSLAVRQAGLVTGVFASLVGSMGWAAVWPVVGRGRRARDAMKAAMSRDWWCRSLAGAVLGATLALALSGLFAWWGPGGVDARDKMQFVMWLIAPLWMTALACVYFVRSGRHAVVALLVRQRPGLGGPGLDPLAGRRVKIASDLIRFHKTLHTGVGIVAGSLLFIGFFAGSLTLFKEPLDRWVHAGARAARGGVGARAWTTPSSPISWRGIPRPPPNSASTSGRPRSCRRRSAGRRPRAATPRWRRARSPDAARTAAWKSRRSTRPRWAN